MQFVITPAAGKRLIGKAVSRELLKSKAIHDGFVVIIAGTTNGYVAEELLMELHQQNGFSRNRFFRGITTPPAIKTTDSGRLPDESEFPGDVVIEKGVWQKGQTVFDVVDGLREGDIIVKGANAVDIVNRQAGVLIGHPKGGTIVASLQAIVGRRTKLLIPVGLEKRISMSIDSVARLLNAPGSTGARFLPIHGDIITELDALHTLYGVTADLVAAGGVCGAEGSAWIQVECSDEVGSRIKGDMEAIAKEGPFAL